MVLVSRNGITENVDGRRNPRTRNRRRGWLEEYRRPSAAGLLRRTGNSDIYLNLKTVFTWVATNWIDLLQTTISDGRTTAATTGTMKRKELGTENC